MVCGGLGWFAVGCGGLRYFDGAPQTHTLKCACDIHSSELAAPLKDECLTLNR